MLWSNFIHEKPLTSIRIIDQEETMLSTDDLAEKDFIHEKSLNSIINFDQEEIIQEVHIHEKPLNSITNFYQGKFFQDGHVLEKALDFIIIFEQEEIIHDVQQSENKQAAIKEFCRILPPPVCKQNLIQMRHERTCKI
jgi:hypothetical protein